VTLRVTITTVGAVVARSDSDLNAQCPGLAHEFFGIVFGIYWVLVWQTAVSSRPEYARQCRQSRRMEQEIQRYGTFDRNCA
jgi:hypothetical protein